MDRWSWVVSWFKLRAMTSTKSQESKAAPVFGRLTGRLDDLEKTEFFQWFNFKRVSDASTDEKIVYSPNSDEIREFVSLIFLLTLSQDISWLTLQISSFHIMYDPQREPFARDLIKSFILAVSGADEARLVALAEEIQFRDLKTPILVRGPGPTLPHKSSDIFNVIMDRARGPLMLELSQIVLWFDNQGRDQARRLIIRAYPVGSDELTVLIAKVADQGVKIAQARLA
jgi:hypothetical protein